jgi:RluA family pseudouridine synthase
MNVSSPLDVLYQDSSLLAVNKPAGLLTIRDGYNPDLPYAVRLLEPVFGRLWVVHRLDRDTSGTLIFARNPSVHRELNMQFENRLTKKEYHAWIDGVPDWEEAVLESPLLVNGDRHHRTILSVEKGKPARTEIEMIEKHAGWSLVLARPKTGYTHQIRAHLKAAGFPILFDPLYGPKPDRWPEKYSKIKTKRLALHAFILSIIHPVTHKPLAIQAPYPPDILQMMAQLKTLE